MLERLETFSKITLNALLISLRKNTTSFPNCKFLPFFIKINQVFEVAKRGEKKNKTNKVINLGEQRNIGEKNK